MRKRLLKIAFSALFAVWSGVAIAQECLPGGCILSTAQYPSATQTTTSTTFAPIAVDMYAGEFSVCNVIAGVTYEWSLCQADGGFTGYDSQLTLFHGTTNTVLCYSDDNCSNDAKIGWTATFTGTVKIQVNQYNCNSNTTNTTLVWRRTTPATPVTDAGVSEVYTLGTLSNTHSLPHVIRALITNTGTTPITNLPVTLNITGANTYNNSANIATLPVGTSTIVTFPAYTGSNTGSNTVTVTIPSDNNSSNNSKMVAQTVTPANQSYAYGTTITDGAGFNGTSGEVAIKFNAAPGASLQQVKPTFNAAGKTFKVRVFDASGAGGTPGTLLYTSANLTSVQGLNTINVSPALSVPTAFYVAIQQVSATTNMELAYQEEDLLRQQTFFSNVNLTAPTWSDLSPAVTFKIMVETVLSGGVTGPDAAVGEVYTLGTISTVHNNPHVVSALISNTGATALSNLPVTLNVTGANTFTNTVNIPSLGAGTSTVVSFPGFSSTNTGNNTITVSVPADANAGNNSKVVTQVVTTASQGYAYGTTIAGGAGINAGTGEVASKFSAAPGATIQQVKPTFNVAGKIYRVRLFDASGAGGTPGTLLYTSANQTSVQGMNTVNISPAVNVPTSFFISIEQVTAGDNMNLGYQVEDPIRAQAFYVNINIATPAWVDLSPGANFRTMIDAVLSSCQLPVQPAAITGPASVCGTAAVTYSVPAVAGATSYTWTLPSGWSGSSTTNSITVTPTTTGGNITVTATNSCGTSAAQTLAVTASPGAPAQPGAISGNAVACSGVSGTYSVAPVSGAATYTWTLPAGWSGTSTTNSITVTAGTSGGTISVVASNGCGTSSARTLAVTTGAAPSTPGSITGNTSVCQNSTNLYSVPAVAGATSYTWTLPSGWSGTSTSNSINVTAGTTSGNISVVATNACGNSAAATLAVTLNAIPAQPGTISGPANLCQGVAGTYTVASVPGATSYNWTLPTGWTGASTTNSISATAGSTGGNITVTATNSCGTSISQTFAVTATAGLPAQPGAITGNATVCQGGNVTYSVPAVTGATSYTWTLPSGWTGTSNTNTINAIAGTTAGTVSVIASNGCGTSPAQTLAVSISPIVQPGTITGTSAVCQGNSETFAVPAVAGATSYNWTLPAGWTGSSTSNSITVTAGTAGGTISVTATDGTCTSAAQTVNVSVNALPVVPTISVAGGVMASSAASGNQWLLNGNPITNATGQFFTPTQNGFYTVMVTNASGCSSTSTPFSFNTLGMADAFAEGMQLKVYPNPGKDVVNIEANTNEDVQVEIHSLVGQVIMRSAATPVNGKVNHKLNTSSLSKGVYLLNLTTKAGKTTSRLVIQ